MAQEEDDVVAFPPRKSELSSLPKALIMRMGIHDLTQCRCPCSLWKVSAVLGVKSCDCFDQTRLTPGGLYETRSFFGERRSKKHAERCRRDDQNHGGHDADQKKNSSSRSHDRIPMRFSIRLAESLSRRGDSTGSNTALTGD